MEPEHIYTTRPWGLATLGMVSNEQGIYMRLFVGLDRWWLFQVGAHRMSFFEAKM